MAPTRPHHQLQSNDRNSNDGHEPIQLLVDQLSEDILQSLLNAEYQRINEMTRHNTLSAHYQPQFNSENNHHPSASPTPPSGLETEIESEIPSQNSSQPLTEIPSPRTPPTTLAANPSLYFHRPTNSVLESPQALPIDSSATTPSPIPERRNSL